MALRTVKPLNEEQWNMVVKALNEDPTSAQKEMMKKATDEAKKLNVIRT